MNIEVGMKCRQVKVIEDYGFDYIGEEFEITKATDTIIMGKGYKNGFGIGFGIDTGEFENYFELIKEEDCKSIEFTVEELQTIYNCLCDAKTQYNNLIDKLEVIMYE